MSAAARLRRFFGYLPAGVRGPWRVFWVGFAVRVLYMTVAHTWRIRVILDHFQFGWELGRIARSVALGRGYADPFLGHTGPTAWIPPLYTLLVAAVFRVFGVYTAWSAWVIFALNSVFSAATALLVYEMAARCYGRRVALWSGWLWALYPAAMQYAVHWVWDMSFSTWLFAWALVLALRIRGVGAAQAGADRAEERDERTQDGEAVLNGAPGLRGGGSGIGRGAGPFGGTARGGLGAWAAFGVCWGAIALSNPSLLIALPAMGLWMVWGTWNPMSQERDMGHPGSGESTSPVRDGGHPELWRGVRGAALAAVLLVLCVTPWVWRNWRVFHAFIPTRGNLGAEMYESTLESNNGFPWGATLPMAETAPEMVRYERMGEVAYVRAQGAAAKQRMRERPREIAGWMAKRVYFFWASVPHPLERRPWVEYVREANFGLLSVTGVLGLLLSLKQRVPGASLFAWMFGCVPLIYYAVTVQARFRHPLEPLICVLSVFLFQSAERGRAWSWRERKENR